MSVSEIRDDACGETAPHCASLHAGYALISHRTDRLYRMTEAETLTARIDALEMRLSHQDRIIEDLNAMVMAQWQEIEKLSRQIVRLSDQVQEAGDSAAGEGPEPPPPHY